MTDTRVYFNANGPTDLGTVLDQDRILPDGASHPSGDLFLYIDFDEGITDWFHHSLVTFV